jgi:hypothetical protein
LWRLGIADQFAAVSRPTRALQLIDRNHRVFAVFDRSGEHGRHGHPRANLFDQPDLEQLMRTNLKDQTTVTLRGNVEVTDVTQDGHGRVRVDFTDRLTADMTAATAERMSIPLDDFIAGAAAQIPVGRVGQPEDVAHAVSYLVSEDASFVSGQVLYLAGGPTG